MHSGNSLDGSSASTDRTPYISGYITRPVINRDPPGAFHMTDRGGSVQSSQGPSSTQSSRPASRGGVSIPAADRSHSSIHVTTSSRVADSGSYSAATVARTSHNEDTAETASVISALTEASGLESQEPASLQTVPVRVTPVSAERARPLPSLLSERSTSSTESPTLSWIENAVERTETHSHLTTRTVQTSSVLRADSSHIQITSNLQSLSALRAQTSEEPLTLDTPAELVGNQNEGKTERDIRIEQLREIYRQQDEENQRMEQEWDRQKQEVFNSINNSIKMSVQGVHNLSEQSYNIGFKCGEICAKCCIYSTVTVIVIATSPIWCVAACFQCDT